MTEEDVEVRTLICPHGRPIDVDCDECLEDADLEKAVGGVQATYAEGSTCRDHTPCPNSHPEWDEWRAEKEKTHIVKRCQGCGRYRIWVMK